MDMTAIPAIALPADPAGDGPRERLAALFDAHEDRLYRLARRLTGSADEARDLVQDTFFKAARSLKSIPAGTTEEEAAAWLVRVLVNIRRDQWRRAAVRTRKAEMLRAGAAIASCLGISAITVGWHLSMARRELKSLLQPHIGDMR